IKKRPGLSQVDYQCSGSSEEIATNLVSVLPSRRWSFPSVIAITRKGSPMTQKYAIDVAFSSATLAANRENPIAMAYGFASALLGGSWHENGQKVERVEGGTDFYFAIFDVA